jgi:hypothetical protein
MIARFIISAATTAVTMAVANYAGKAVGEKIRKDHGAQIDAFKARQAALKLMKHLVQGNTLNIKSTLSEKLWETHSHRASVGVNRATALFVLKDRPAAVIVTAVADSGEVIVSVDDGKHNLTKSLKGVTPQAAVKAVIGDNFFIEGCNLDEEVKEETNESNPLDSLFK